MLKMLLLLVLAGPFGDSTSPRGTRYGEIGIADNATAQVVSTTDAWHLLYTVGACHSDYNLRFTYLDGDEGNITAFADAGGGKVQVTSAAHGLADGQWVSIVGTTNYNVLVEVSNAAANTFEVTATWVANDATGRWVRGCSLTAGPATRGIFLLGWSGSFAGSGAATAYDFCPFVEGVCEDHCERRRSSGNASVFGVAASTCFVEVAPGDVVTFGVTNVANTNNFTMRSFDLNIHKL